MLLRRVRSSAALLARQLFESPQSFSLKSPGSLAFLGFVACYLVLIQYFRMVAYRDPTSFFFDPDRAYVAGYSITRKVEADAFVKSAGAATTNLINSNLDSTPQICIGVATVAREGKHYFSTSIGSLIDGLTLEERKNLFLIVFVAHTSPEKHPDYSAKWLHNVADKVITYDLPEAQFAHVRELEGDPELAFEKGMFDYTYLLKACAAVGAPYILMVEDDVIAIKDWYPRTRQALEQAEKETDLKGEPEFLYLRLFYTEQTLGWNIEEWPHYLFWCFVWIAGPTCALLALRRYQPSSRKYISMSSLTVFCCICLPMCIVLFFAAGRVTLYPLPAGVNEMPAYGCCSQSLLFPRAQVPTLVKWYESKGVGMIDSITEELADEKGLLRWALTPSPMQHIGSKSSKGDDFGKNTDHHIGVVPGKVFNFAFEQLEG